MLSLNSGEGGGDKGLKTSVGAGDMVKLEWVVLSYLELVVVLVVMKP